MAQPGHIYCTFFESPSQCHQDAGATSGLGTVPHLRQAEGHLEASPSKLGDYPRAQWQRLPLLFQTSQQQIWQSDAAGPVSTGLCLVGKTTTRSTAKFAYPIANWGHKDHVPPPKKGCLKRPPVADPRPAEEDVERSVGDLPATWRPRPRVLCLPILPAGSCRCCDNQPETKARLCTSRLDDKHTSLGKGRE